MKLDPLEQELEALELPEIPVDIRSCIARAVEDDRNANLAQIGWRRRLTRVAAAGMAIAASFAVAILVIHGHRGRSIDLPDPVALPANADLHDDHPEMRMTLAMYASAEHQSWKALDSMLDADAARPVGLMRGATPRATCRSLDDLDP